MIVEQFINNISDEVDYRFGTPWRYSDKSLGVIVPILKRDEYEFERNYITFEEVKDKNISIKDTGRIDRVIIQGSSDEPIFIRSGTAFKSAGTQPRAVESSVVIISQEGKEKEKIEIPVRCIHASRPISAGVEFHHAGDVPLGVRSALMSKSGQRRTWSAVGDTTHRFMSSGRLNIRSRIQPDNLVGVMEEVDKFTSGVEDILKNIPLFENQVGAVFLDTKDVVGIELFDHPKSWEAIHKEVEKRFGESAAKEQQSFFSPDYEKIKPLTLEFLKKLIESEKTETSHGTISTVTLKGDGVIGEATTIDGKIIHLVGIKTEKVTDNPTGINLTNTNWSSLSQRYSGGTF